MRLLLWVFVLFILVWGVRLGAQRLFPMPYRETVLTSAEKYDVSPALLYALIKAESNFDAAAESQKGAKGLMQLMDETAAECAEKTGLSLTDIFAPEQNITLGAYYLGKLLDMYAGDEKSAVAAYNAGHGRVDSWLSDLRYSPDGKTLSEIPFPETQRYVRKVQLYTKIYEKRIEKNGGC